MLTYLLAICDHKWLVLAYNLSSQDKFRPLQGSDLKLVFSFLFLFSDINYKQCFGNEPEEEKK